MADHEESQAARGCRDALVEYAVAEPGPEKDLAYQLDPAVPPCRSFARAQSEQQVLPAQSIEIESTKAKDGIIEKVLIFDREFGERIVSHHAVVVGRS